MTDDELTALERHGWEALSSTGEAAGAFYERLLDDEVIMLLPGGMVLDDRAAIVKSMSGPPWSQYTLSDGEPGPATPSTKGSIAVPEACRHRKSATKPPGVARTPPSITNQRARTTRGASA
jgi:hypothetical protein